MVDTSAQEIQQIVVKLQYSRCQTAGLGKICRKCHSGIMSLDFGSTAKGRRSTLHNGKGIITSLTYKPPFDSFPVLG
jgi:hypothetical protein